MLQFHAAADLLKARGVTLYMGEVCIETDSRQVERLRDTYDAIGPMPQIKVFLNHSRHVQISLQREAGAHDSPFQLVARKHTPGGKNTGPASRAMAKGYEWDPAHTWLASDLANLLEELAKPGVAAKMDMGDPRSPEPEARAALVQLIKDVSARPKAQDPQEREQGQVVYDGKNWREAEGKDEL